MLHHFAQFLLRQRPGAVTTAAVTLALLAVCATIAAAASSNETNPTPWALYIALGSLLVNVLFQAGMYKAVVVNLGKTVGEHDICLMNPEHGLVVKVRSLEATSVSQQECRSHHEHDRERAADKGESP